jgi:hypothetical protein
MKSILRVLAIVNNNYDKTKEPERFIIGISFGLGPWFIMDTLGMILGNIGLQVFGVIWVIIIMSLRMWWIAGNLKKYL